MANKKLISWNVNYLRLHGKGIHGIFEQADADIFCLQEIKLQEGQIDWNKEGYYAYWNYAEKKGYSGTAIFAEEPLQVTYGLGIEEHDQEGRMGSLEFPEYCLITNIHQIPRVNLQRLDYRMKWKMISGISVATSENKPVIVCGDMNVAHKEIDLKSKDKQKKCRIYR